VEETVVDASLVERMKLRGMLGVQWAPIRVGERSIVVGLDLSGLDRRMLDQFGEEIQCRIDARGF
jgi:hypothetical protein